MRPIPGTITDPAVTRRLFPAPLTVGAWSARCILASFPQGERLDPIRLTREYLAWLNSLPEVTS
jgi:hypothetical protein